MGVKCVTCHSEFCFEDYRLRVAGKKNRVLQIQTTKSSPKKGRGKFFHPYFPFLPKLKQQDYTTEEVIPVAVKYFIDLMAVDIMGRR